MNVCIRNMFVAPKGFKLVENDLSQAESRIVAWLSKDKPLMKQFREDKIDGHTKNASDIFLKDMSEISGKERTLGKKIVHGTNYDMGAKTMVESIIKDLGMEYEISISQAKVFKDNYHKARPRLAHWHREIKWKVSNGEELVNPWGRRKKFYCDLDYKLWKEAYAWIPQSTCVDTLNRGLIKHEKVLWEFPILLQLHDGTLSLWPKDVIIKKYRTMLKHCYEHVMLIHGEELVIPVDTKEGVRWGELKELK